MSVMLPIIIQPGMTGRLLPIALALGASAKSRVSLGVVVIGGSFFSLVLSLFVIPIIYSLIAKDKKNSREKIPSISNS